MKDYPPQKNKNKKKVWIITCTTIWVCHHYCGVFFAFLLILEYPDHRQNLISSSLCYPGPLHKISSQSVHNFLSNVVHRQTDRQTDKQTNATKNITSFAKEVTNKQTNTTKNITSFAKEVITRNTESTDLLDRGRSLLPYFPNVIMLSLGGERLTPKVLDHYLHHDLAMLPLLRCLFTHLLILEYPDHHQNLFSSSLYYPGPLHKISSQSVHNVLSNVVHRQTDRQTNATKNITSFTKEVIIIIRERSLFMAGGGGGGGWFGKIDRQKKMSPPHLENTREKNCPPPMTLSEKFAPPPMF